MKNKILASIICLFMSLLVEAQYPSMYKDINHYKTIDRALYQISYNIHFTLDREKGKTSEDRIILTLGKYRSATHNVPLLESKRMQDSLVKKGARNVPMYQKVTFPEDVFKYRDKGEMEVLYRTYTQAPHYLYKEPLSLFSWDILPTYKELVGYRVQKATCNFRGRKYIAWFAENIPYSDGPWKFGGLPGLILEVADEKGEFSFICDEIKHVSDGSLVKQWTWTQQKTTRVKLRELVRRMHAHPHQFLESSTGYGIILLNGGNPTKIHHPYNPIELE